MERLAIARPMHFLKVAPYARLRGNSVIKASEKGLQASRGLLVLAHSKGPQFEHVRANHPERGVEFGG